MITVAEEAIAVPDFKNNRMQLSLRNYSTHEMSKDLMSRDTVAPTGQQGLDASPPSRTPLRSVGMGTRQLMAYPRNKPDWIEYQIELHRRFALPVACLMLAMVGIPLGIATRKGGRAAGYVNAIFVAFFCYYLAFVSLIGLARQRTLPVPVALWLPNAVFFVAGLIFLARLEKPGDSDFFGDLRARVGGFLQGAEGSRAMGTDRPGAGGVASAAVAAVGGYLHSFDVRDVPGADAGEPCLAGADLQLLRADRRHAAQQHLALEDVHVPLLPDARS